MHANLAPLDARGDNSAVSRRLSAQSGVSHKSLAAPERHCLRPIGQSVSLRTRPEAGPTWVRRLRCRVGLDRPVSDLILLSLEINQTL
jgi:hypothetical protein